jgi:predicted CXXCH cytochrome family protein
MAPRCSTIRRWRGPVAGILIFLVGGALSTLLIGCADPQKRYEVLSLFFDGVPDPNAPQKQSSSSKVSMNGRRTVVHKPFADNLCNSCHINSADIFARAQVKEDVCLNCHSNVPTQHAVMHGPVVNNACQMCHSPHSSAVPHLLKQPAPAVCTQCHEPESMQLMHKQPLDPKQSCIDCHSGHGGTDHKLLLATPAAPAAPATRPALLRESEVPR